MQFYDKTIANRFSVQYGQLFFSAKSKVWVTLSKKICEADQSRVYLQPIGFLIIGMRRDTIKNKKK